MWQIVCKAQGEVRVVAAPWASWRTRIPRVRGGEDESWIASCGGALGARSGGALRDLFGRFRSGSVVVFTTYFWLAFPAVGLLASGVTGLAERLPVHASEEARERELLEAIRGSGEISAAAAAVETSMTVAEVDRRLRELAEGGHLELRVRGGAIFYALWEAEERQIEGVR